MTDEHIQDHPLRAGLGPKDRPDDDWRAEPDIALRPTDVTAVFFGWEKLRLVFNVFLLGLLLCYFNPLQSLILALRALELAVAANLCFCAGPVVESYLSWLKPRKRVRWIMFLIGLVYSCHVTTVLCAQIVANPEGRWQLGGP